jgi:hypothetical protein
MFYVYLIIGLAIFTVGLVFTPGWWKIVWVIGSVVEQRFYHQSSEPFWTH